MQPLRTHPGVKKRPRGSWLFLTRQITGEETASPTRADLLPDNRKENQ